MKVIFAGTPEFAATALEALLAAGFEVPLVLTQPDRPAGRGMQLQASPVKQLALAHAIPVAQPTSLRLNGKYPDEAAAAHELLHNTAHDVMVVAAYGLILPLSVLDIAPLGCLNIHGSLLPRWRGAAPIHRAIEAGDRETGITIMQMDEGLDTGDMLLWKSIAIDDQDTTSSLHDKLALLGGQLIVEALRRIENGGLVPTPQPLEGVSYASKIDKAEAALSFAQDAQVLARKIRALNPFPGATAQAGDALIKIWRAEVVDAASGEPGDIIAHDEDTVLVRCGRGALKLLELQKAGGKRLPVREFIKGFKFEGLRLT